MNSIIINDTEKFKQIIENFEKITKDINLIFQNENNNIDSINTNEIWEGIFKDKTIEKYDDLKSKYEIIINSLEQLSSFMNNTLNSYMDLDQKLLKEIDTKKEKLMINSEE